MMKKITFLLAMLLAFSYGYGQTMLAQFDFENPGGYTTSIPEFTDQGVGSGEDYFIRTDGSTINGETFSNIQDIYYFAAKDIDGEGATLPVSLLLNNINISGYTSLEFRVHLAEDDDGTNEDWDNADYVHFNYDIDNTGTFSNLLWIENDGSGTNNEPLIDTNFDGNGDGTAITDTFTQFTQSIAGTGDLLDIEILFNLNSEDEDIAIDNIEIWGTLAPCNPAVTWNGSTWSNGTGPDINTSATIAGDYNTDTNGSFSACSLTINSSFNLTVNNGDYVEIQNDVTVDGQLFVETQGNFIQNNDLASFTDNSTTTNGVLMNKTKNVANKFVYTYWSSPSVSETIENVFSTVAADKRYEFIAANFIDLLEEIGNTDTFLPNAGVDDIDDDGNDWDYASGTMQPGVGYAMRNNTFVFSGYPADQTFVFRGEFNNGVVSVPLVNNSGGQYNDWNLIGNPYPCAIDADQFFTVNTGIVDAIYLWDQFTAPSETASGSEGYNFSGADYAAINGAGEIAGGSGTLPLRFIPSGQGFFVEALSASNVIFNNSMRSITNNNSQFFKGKSSKSNLLNNVDKLWVNLKSDNGAFNQILISYIKGATNLNDGSFYDLKRPVSTGNKALLYSLIDNDNGKFAIQGKANNSLNTDEVVKLGFKTTIDVATIYTLSIAQLEGDFLSNNTIYLKDKLTNTVHNLSNGDYSFTSEVGEFNERFEIAFNAASLSNDTFALNNNAIKIVQLDNNNVKFTTETSTFKSITVFDLLGRALQTFNGDSNNETYNLSTLKNSVYIANIELQNGVTLSKKFIKK